MDMTCHKTISGKLHTFVRPTITDTVCQYIKIDLSRKYVQPIHGCKRDKIETCFVMEFIFPTHTTNIQLVTKGINRYWHSLETSASFENNNLYNQLRGL